MEYDRVFVHAGQMAKVGEEYEFLPEDRHGFLHGEIRVEAIKILRKQGKVKKIIVVGGPTEDGMNKVKLIAERIGGKVIQLESTPSTRNNLEVVKEYLGDLGDDEGKNGLLTNFYHLPRAMRLSAEKGLNLIPVCAEAILLTDDPHYWEGKIEKWYSQDSMLARFLWEIQGLSCLEKEKYDNYRLEFGG